MNQDNSATSDEFKYGFPSCGLSSVSYRWWSNKTETNNGGNSQQKVDKNADETRQQPEAPGNSAANLPSINGETKEEKTHEIYRGDSQLSSLRKKAAKEGQQALKLGVHRGYGAQTLDQTKKSVLHKIFKSSLPSEWGDLTS